MWIKTRNTLESNLFRCFNKIHFYSKMFYIANADDQLFKYKCKRRRAKLKCRPRQTFKMPPPNLPMKKYSHKYLLMSNCTSHSILFKNFIHNKFNAQMRGVEIIKLIIYWNHFVKRTYFRIKYNSIFQLSVENNLSSFGCSEFCNDSILWNAVQ